MPIVLNKNLNTEQGMVNGMLGKAVGIVVNEEMQALRIRIGQNIIPYHRPPLCVLIQLDEECIKHDKFPFLTRSIVPIFPTIINVKVPSSGRVKGKMQLVRMQVPCSPAFSVTIQKSQGKTYDRAIIDIVKSQSPRYGSTHDNYALLYITLSRVRSMSSLEILTTFDRSVLHYRPDPRLVDDWKG
ncbi:hypothetical protein Q9L58_009749 [Maublancomyces gigas]|uniref:Uncharacterized protein n=1 Tax=Discina gigas TaxID=1032678 RepID=A0ABR3G615_9PEZI